MHLIVFYFAVGWLGLLLGVCLILLIRERSALVQILALDTFSLMLIALLVVLTHVTRSAYYLDAALALALLTYVSTLAAAHYDHTGKIFSIAILLLSPGLVVGETTLAQVNIPSPLGWMADALIIAGLLIMGVAVYGMLWLPDIYTRMHAASKISVLGLIPMLVTVIATGELAIIARAILTGVFLLLTTPVASHAILRSAYLSREPMLRPDALDESGKLRVEQGEESQGGQ